MKEKKRRNLKKAVTELPCLFLSDDLMWGHVEAGLNSLLKVKLPDFKAPEQLWDGIKQELDIQQDKPVRKFNFNRAAAAASVILVTALGIYLLAPKFANRNQYPGYAEKAISDTADIVNSIYNPELCENNPRICKSPAFLDLEKQLDEVKSELELIHGYIRNDDPQMMKYYYRLENTRVEIEKKMVKIILQS